MNNLKKNLLLFFVIIGIVNCTSPIKEDVENKTAKKDVLKTKLQLERRVPAGPNPYADQYWDAPCHCWKPGKKPKPLIKLANPPLSPLYFKYKIIDYPYSPSRSDLYPSPNKKNTYNLVCVVEWNLKYDFELAHVVDIIHDREPTFPINSIRRIELKSGWGNFTIYNRDNSIGGYGTYFHPNEVQYIGTSLYYIRDRIFVKIYMNKPYKDLDEFEVYWHYKIKR